MDELTDLDRYMNDLKDLLFKRKEHLKSIGNRESAIHRDHEINLILDAIEGGDALVKLMKPVKASKLPT